MCREFGWTMEYAYTRTLNDLFGEGGILRQKEDVSLARQNFIRNHRKTVVQRADGTWYRPGMEELLAESARYEKRAMMQRLKNGKKR